jgi:putative mRNA 3-end processing factor
MELTTSNTDAGMAEAESNAASVLGRLPNPLLRLDDRGLYCERGGFHIDPWLPVENAVITHAHGDHARAGSKKSFCANEGLPVMQHRLGVNEPIQGVPYGEVIQLGETQISFHPAGHILGSAQVRIECDGQVWVVSGDYKRAHDPTCEPWEVVECDVFITEATFGLPIYKWESGAETARQILEWWDGNIRENRPSLLFSYALGKAQRVLAEMHALDKTRHVYTHGAVESLTQVYRNQGIEMTPTTLVGEVTKGTSFGGELIIAPPSAYRSLWMKRFKGADTGFASGWMQVRGNRRRKGYDRGFVLSDHADWPDLIRTVKDSKARLTLPTHGSVDNLARYLNEIGHKAIPLNLAAYSGEAED